MNAQLTKNIKNATTNVVKHATISHIIHFVRKIVTLVVSAKRVTFAIKPLGCVFFHTNAKNNHNVLSEKSIMHAVVVIELVIIPIQSAPRFAEFLEIATVCLIWFVMMKANVCRYVNAQIMNLQQIPS